MPIAENKYITASERHRLGQPFDQDQHIRDMIGLNAASDPGFATAWAILQLASVIQGLTQD